MCYIPNGVTVTAPTDRQLICQSYGFQGNDYVLFLARLVPEKRAEWVIRAFLQAATPLRLVVAARTKFTAPMPVAWPTWPEVIRRSFLPARWKAA